MHHGEYSLAQLIDIERLQRTCDMLSAASGIVLAVLDPDGSILVASGWQDVCTRFHRAEEATAAGCLESDRRINEQIESGSDAPAHIAYRCANGLWDVAFPLMLDGHHVATVFTGQFFYDDDVIDMEWFRARAREYGFDEPAYLDALMRVPVVSHEQVERTIGFLADLVGMLGELGLHALRERESHAALAASEQQFRSMAEDMPVFVSITDADDRILYMNPATAAFVGKTTEKLTGSRASDLRDQEAQRRVAEAQERLTPDHPVETHEERVRIGDAPPRWIEWTNRGFFDEDGRLQRVQAMGRDITERRAAAEDLRRSREQYETFLNATDDIAYLKDADLRYVMVNTANARFFGLSPEEIRGRTDHELMPEEQAASCRASDLHALKTGGVVVTTEIVGDTTYESRKFPVEMGDGRVGVGGYVRDVTEQRRADAEIRRLAADLERRVAQRTAQLEATNRELESFAYSISHDLRAPLRALNGFSEILLQDHGAALDDEARRYLGRIKGAADHMAGLMDGLLQLSRLNREDLELERVDLSRLARDVVDELRRQDPGRKVDVLVESDLVADADARLMRVALANLLGNAWKFTSRHETARIEVGLGRAGKDDGGAAFYVKDDGAGFDPRYARNLFGAFQRLHTPDQFEGTGIGLATVQRIVHRHGGEVWAEGEVEKGATFWFTLAPATLA